MHFFSTSKSIFFGFYKIKNQTGTTVGKPQILHNRRGGVDFLFSRAKILHRALNSCIKFKLPGELWVKVSLSGCHNNGGLKGFKPINTREFDFGILKKSR